MKIGANCKESKMSKKFRKIGIAFPGGNPLY